MNRTAWPPTGGYEAAPSDLGFTFSYPDEYLESIRWQDADVAAGGDGLLLAFLQVNEVVQWLNTTRRAANRPLVPFARGDNGDWLCCFDAADSSKVYVINLGDKTPTVVEWSSTGYLGFLDAYLPNFDLPVWRPSGKHST